MSELQCIVVTPEKTELDVEAQSVTLPMIDGEMGILKGHSPLVGRLGFGVLRVRAGGEVKSSFVEGGFAQVVNNEVSVLTDHLVPMNEITSEAASSAMKDALQMPTDKADLAAAREKAINRAHAMARVAAQS